MKPPSVSKFINALPRWILAVFCLLILSLLPIALEPVAFLKSVTIVENPVLPPLSPDSPALDTDAAIGPIPYQAIPHHVTVTDPARLYQQTILAGNGNCSDMVKGFAHFLHRQGIDYQIIHMLPRKHLFQGWGHAILRLPVARQDGPSQVGLLDVFEGSLVTYKHQLIDVPALKDAPPEEIVLQSLARHPRPKGFTRYSLHLRTGTLGYTPAAEMQRFFNFVEVAPLPGDNIPGEYYLYSMSALLLDVYPHIYVESISQTFAPELLPWRTFYLADFWLLRFSLILLVALCVLYGLTLPLKKRLVAS